MALVRGKISAKDREGNIGDELKILVDDAREITPEQASLYQATGRKPKPLAEGRRKSAYRATVMAERSTATATVARPVERVPVAPPRVYIRLADTRDQQILLSLKQTIDANSGQTDVVLVLGAERQIIKLPSGVRQDEAVIGELRSLVGADNVKYQ